MTKTKHRTSIQIYRDQKGHWLSVLDHRGIDPSTITTRRDCIKLAASVLQRAGHHTPSGASLRMIAREIQWGLRIPMGIKFTHRLFPRGFWLNMGIHKLRSGRCGQGETTEQALARLEKENKADAIRRFQATRTKWLSRPIIKLSPRGRKVTLKQACGVRAKELKKVDPSIALDPEALYAEAKKLFMDGAEANEALGMALNAVVQSGGPS